MASSSAGVETRASAVFFAVGGVGGSDGCAAVWGSGVTMSTGDTLWLEVLPVTLAMCMSPF